MNAKIIPPLVCIALGIGLAGSVFFYARTYIDTLLVGFFLAPLIALFSLMSLVDRRVRFATTAAGMLLVVTGLGLKHYLGNHVQVAEVSVGLLVVLLSLIPNFEFAGEAAVAPVPGPQ